MATSGKFRLSGVLDTFVLDGTSTNYAIKNTSGQTFATFTNGNYTTNSTDAVFNSNLANGSYTSSINTAISSLSGTSANSNSATINPNSQSGASGGSTPSPTQPTQTSFRSSRESSLVYPIKMSVDQDHIRFTIWKIKKSSNIKAENLADSFRSARETQSFGSRVDTSRYERVSAEIPIILPIQAPINDQNSVNWGAGELNELQRILLKASATAMTAGDGNVAAAFNAGMKEIATSVKGQESQLKNLLYIALLEQAVNAPGLLSRATGGVLNPNMELLFQGPQLRPFNFTFKLSPRSKPEADTVKKIIRAFKKNMAPKIEGLFLASPNVFQIEYVHGKSNNMHSSINLIKMCSLQNCSVDYTPLGTYATFDDTVDPEASMVSYTMNLTFSEIDPIYDKDYNEGHSIGF